jgi:hypothetical protein
MSALQELIDAADKLCNNLDIASQNEKKFATDVCLELERFSWEMYRMKNDIQHIQEYFGKR